MIIRETLFSNAGNYFGIIHEIYDKHLQFEDKYSVFIDYQI